jgi:hypothetical protein
MAVSVGLSYVAGTVKLVPLAYASGRPKGDRNHVPILLWEQDSFILELHQVETDDLQCDLARQAITAEATAGNHQARSMSDMETSPGPNCGRPFRTNGRTL